jgi:hypothetical protein
MPIVQNPSIGAGAVPLLKTTSVLTSAQIQALHSVGAVLVPAPGAGLITVVLGVALMYNFGTHAYVTQGADEIQLVYTGDFGLVAPEVFQLIPAAESAYAYVSGLAGATSPLNLAADENATVLITSSADYNAGPIASATLGAGGLGYAANDTGTITNGANDATYKVLTVGAGGAVLTFEITGAGTKCNVANGQATATGGAQPGVGVGFTVNITAVKTGDGTLKVVTYYQIIPVP